jgi:hypothetical protein
VAREYLALVALVLLDEVAHIHMPQTRSLRGDLGRLCLTRPRRASQEHVGQRHTL